MVCLVDGVVERRGSCEGGMACVVGVYHAAARVVASGCECSRVRQMADDFTPSQATAILVNIAIDCRVFVTTCMYR